MRTALGVASLLLALYSLRGPRWAYIAFVVIAVSSIPSRTAFQLHAPLCETAVTAENALFSLTNYKHIVIFAIFFLITIAQFRPLSVRSFVWSALITLAYGLVLELEEGATGTGHCRLRDLVPDTAGLIIAVIALSGSTVLRRRVAQ